MKPSKLLKAEQTFNSDLTYIQSTEIKETEQILLSLIQEKINSKTKSFVFINEEDHNSKKFVVELIAYLMNTTSRNINNENYLKPRQDQYDGALNKMDSYVTIVKDFNSFFTTNSTKTPENEGSCFFILDLAKSLKKNKFIGTGTNEALVPVMFRFCRKITRVFKAKVFIGSDYQLPNNVLVSVANEDSEVLSSFYKIHEDGLFDMTTKAKTFLLTKENHKLSISKNFKGFKIDKNTGLFSCLDHSDILNLKELLRELSRNGKVNKHNTYIKEWIKGYKEIDTREQLLEFQNKAYLSIVNKLQVAN